MITETFVTAFVLAAVSFVLMGLLLTRLVDEITRSK